MNELEPIDPDLSSLLQAEREITMPAEAVRARMLARLESVLPPLGPGGGSGGGDGGSGGHAPPSATSGGAARHLGSLTSGKLLASAALLAVGAAGGAGVHAAATNGARREVAVMTAPPPIVFSIQVQERAPEPPPTAPGTASAEATAAAPTSYGERVPVETQLKGERLILAAARTALGRGDTDSALAAVQRHAREYPHGQLSEEREVLRVQVLRAAGDEAGARARASAFKRAYPNSLMQNSVDKAAKPGMNK